MGVFEQKNVQGVAMRSILHSSFFILHFYRKVMKTSWKEVLLRAVIAAVSAALTALGTTSCMGLGPISL